MSRVFFISGILYTLLFQSAIASEIALPGWFFRSLINYSKDIHPHRKMEVGVRTDCVAWKLTHSDKIL